MTGLPPGLTAPAMSRGQVVEKLIGGWELVRWATYHPDGTESLPFGEDAIGVIIYTADGHMSCHLSMANRPLFAEPSI